MGKRHVRVSLSTNSELEKVKDCAVKSRAL